MRLRIVVLSTFVFSITAMANISVFADVFDEPKNLKVLPADISPEELRGTMLGFSGALNAKCSFCHEVDDDLKMPNPDFSSDAKETKKIAREMLKLVADINKRISGMDHDPGQQRVEVKCVTCHRGQYRPLLILPVLKEARGEGGIEAVIAKYSELRERYFGNHTYDLRPSTLAGFARSIAAEGDVDGAIKLLDYAYQNFPDEERVLFALARVHQRAGNNDRATVFLRRLVELFPESSFYAKQLALAEGKSAD